MGMAAINKLPGPHLKEAPPKIWLQSVVSEEMFENVGTHTFTHTHIRTPEAYLSYKLTTEPLAQVS